MQGGSACICAPASFYRKIPQSYNSIYARLQSQEKNFTVWDKRRGCNAVPLFISLAMFYLMASRKAKTKSIIFLIVVRTDGIHIPLRRGAVKTADIEYPAVLFLPTHPRTGCGLGLRRGLGCGLGRGLRLRNRLVRETDVYLGRTLALFLRLRLGLGRGLRRGLRLCNGHGYGHIYGRLLIHRLIHRHLLIHGLNHGNGLHYGILLIDGLGLRRGLMSFMRRHLYDYGFALRLRLGRGLLLDNYLPFRSAVVYTEQQDDYRHERADYRRASQAYYRPLPSF